MKLARTGIIAAAILSAASVAFAQKPDFSGTWTPDASATAPGAGGGGGRGGGRGMMGGPMVVKQTADALTIERTRGENKIVTTYKLDGTESENKTMGRGGNAMVSTSTAKWDGDKLTITTKSAGRDGAERVSTEVWMLEGGNLTIQSTRQGRGGEPMTSKLTYKKST